MAKQTKFCPRCGELLKRNTERCPNCGATVLRSKNDEERRIAELAAKRNEHIEKNVKLGENISAAKREQLEKQAKREAELAALAQADEPQEMSKTKAKKLEKDRKKSKKKKQKKQYVHKKPELTETVKNADGTVAVDVRDVSFLPKEEIVVRPKKHKIPEKLKWYDVAKWADRMLARRKVKRVVNKASTEIPADISKGSMIAFCVFFGWMGAHNFYAKNWTKAGIILGSFLISLIVLSVDVLQKAVGVSIGGGFGLVFVLCWIWDLVRIIANKYRYRESRLKFIATLDFDTRAILGRKYIKKEIEENELYEQSRN